MAGKIIVGNCMDVLRELPAESWQNCTTSPPYWGLRSYGTEPVVWGGNRACEHVWGDEIVSHQRGQLGEMSTLDGGAPHRQQDISQGQRCQRCGAWRGELGLEPDVYSYIDHLVEVFREVKRVLRKDGTLWLNLGGSYAGANWRGGGVNTASSKQLSNRGTLPMMGKTRKFIPEGLKPKDLVGVPWLAALALQADGWWLRSDIILSRLNPMPESVTDRPTKAHEYLFLLAKSPQYYYDAEAIAEPKSASTRRDSRHNGDGQRRDRDYPGEPSMGGTNLGSPDGLRNARSVWTVVSRPYRGAHHAVMAPSIAERCILAGTSAKGACPECGAPWERADDGWGPTCRCYNKRTDSRDDWPTVPCVVGDPFGGAGTTAVVALEHGRDYVLIEINPEYARLAEERINGVQCRLPHDGAM